MRKKTNFVDRNGNDIFVGDRVRITEVGFLGKPAVSEGKVYYDKSDDSYGIRFFPKGDDCWFWWLVRRLLRSLWSHKG